MSEEDKKDDEESKALTPSEVKDSGSVQPEQNEIARQYIEEGTVDKPFYNPPSGATGPTGPWGTTGFFGFSGTTGPTGPWGAIGVGFGATGPRFRIPDVSDNTIETFSEDDTDLDD